MRHKRTSPVRPKLSRECLDVPLGTYFTEKDVKRILETLPEPEAVTLDEAWDSLELSAHLFACSAWPDKKPKKPSERVRRYQTAHNRLSAALTSIKAFSETDEFEIAADLVARRAGSLPDFEIEFDFPDIEPEGSLPAYKQISKAIENMEWLLPVLEKAATIAEDAKTQGKQNDQPRYFFFWLLSKLTEDIWRQPKMSAWTDRITEETKGPLADFLEAVSRPLSIDGSRAALVKTFGRAKTHWSERKKGAPAPLN